MSVMAGTREGSPGMLGVATNTKRFGILHARVRPSFRLRRPMDPRTLWRKDASIRGT